METRLSRYTLVLIFLLLSACSRGKQASLPITPVQELSFEQQLYSELLLIDTRGIDPRYLLAMAILETGHGTGGVYGETHNLFSIKAQGYSGDSFCTDVCYRRYRDNHESVQDFVRLITTRSRYQIAYKYALMDERKQFFRALQNAKYAEDPHYAQKLEKAFQDFQRTEVNKRLAQYQIVACSINNDSACPTLRK